jgi:hypothetical protein
MRAIQHRGGGCAACVGNPFETPDVFRRPMTQRRDPPMKRISEDRDALEPMTERRALLAFSLIVVAGLALLAGRLAVPDLWP